MTLDHAAGDYLNSLEPATSSPPIDPDQHRWSWLHAQLGEHNAPQELREALYFLQAMGATFEPADRGMRLTRGKCPPRIYDAIKDEILAKYASTLAPILRGMREH